jgi:hypothetical protein
MLTKKQKEKLMGKQITIDHALVPEYKNFTEGYGQSFHMVGIKKVVKKKLPKPIAVWVAGFTHICEGKMNYSMNPDEQSNLTPTGFIRCIKVVRNTRGGTSFTSLDQLEDDDE